VAKCCCDGANNAKKTMENKLFNPAFKTSINQKFREKRFDFFKSLLGKIKSDGAIEILDVGGTETYWEYLKFLPNEKVHITLLNLNLIPLRNNKFTSLKGDACDLSAFRDKQIDIVFSNSVIEHLFSRENQKKMADEIRRVGKNYYVQTPNRYFPIEPHWVFPLFQFLPFSIKVFLTRNFNFGSPKAATKEEAVRRVREVKLLSKKEMEKLFPEAKIYKEKFLGLTKSVSMYYFPETT
jgi:hypothetical protein